MDEEKLRTTGEFHDFIVEHHANAQHKRPVFRGVPKAAYELVPSLGRTTKRTADIRDLERNTLWLFRVYAVAYLNTVPTSNWEWLALAQHHGVPTRLLDWTLNAWAALFFAVADGEEEDCAVYIADLEGFLPLEIKKEPWELSEVSAFIPPHISRRIGAQQAIHTVHPDPRTAWTDARVTKIVLPGSEKDVIRWSLEKMGITAASMFPDLQGVGAHLRWMWGFGGPGHGGSSPAPVVETTSDEVEQG